MSKGREAILALADGRVFRGRAFGAVGEAVGEAVFNTAMTGYQEVLTDPSYKGQLVCMTYPEIGNVGINAEDAESRRVYVEGFIVKEYWARPSNWRSEMPLGRYLEDAGVVGIEGIDTRALVRHLRTRGAQEAVISSVDLDTDSLVRKAKASPGLVGRDLVKEVTSAEPYNWDFGDWKLGSGHVRASYETARDAPTIVALDYGIKLNILRRLVATGFRVKVLPAASTAEQILAHNPDGVFLSNGPGDPAALPYAYRAIAGVLGKKPVFGICLGHQLLGLALGGKTYKLDFGHHGANHPVMDLRTRRVEITSQNHGFAVNDESLKGRAILSHLNLNDNTVEGLQGTGVPFFSVQYHPEASPGPHDSSYLFARFRKLVETFPRYGAEALERIIAAEALAQAQIQ
ncbi:MAG TPA: glutamine-hydrolyzing carbamoyl-phosphate synthase small subunit [Candidatus Binatus sp.]|jgi:carbamoyl-phosphate synthase small subunit|uniref:glutamine-hydrolyzing carbamoyl-phosphate synthase small subunit n=1 Tax=Candidatus Binatus sp. TaxID=2811406 RepID=UPI002F42E0EF